MGTDNLFHINKARKAESHKRKKARRAPYERLMIVCEGKKTEPNYFREFCKSFSINPMNVVIVDKKHGLDPLNLVKYAIDEYKKDSDYDHIYCVFDRDKHKTYDSAVNKIRDYRTKKGTILHQITSIPCFEIWLLLHFTFTTRSFCAACEDSNCALLISELIKYIPGYEKGANNIFIGGDSLKTAIENARKLENYHQTSGTDNPSTKVYKLVEHLMLLKRKNT